VTPSAPPQSSVSASPEQAVTRLFTGPLSADWFAPSFVRAIPVSKLEKVLARVSGGLGAFQRVTRRSDDFAVEFERGSVPTDARLDAEGRFTMLFFHPAELPPVPLNEAVDALATLRGQTSVLVLADGAERAAHRADEPMAVGSTFKLAVLAVVRDDIDRKRRSWTDIVALRAADRSVPSGFLQTWPEGSRLTLESLASLMISLSDNTAADTLLHLVGRDRVEALSSRNRPLLSTREISVLKADGNGELLGRYQAGDESARRAILAEIAAQPVPAKNRAQSKPVALEVEWLYTARELCALMSKVQDLPLMSIDSGPARAADWDHVGYKGGSEPGVINMTTWVRKGARSHCVSATWNDPVSSVDDGVFASAYGRVIASLARVSP
jgi:beta-lactamase class A